jgi:hypothetical protein
VVRDLGEFAVQDLRRARTGRNKPYTSLGTGRNGARARVHDFTANQNCGRDCCHGRWRIVRSAAAGMRLLRRYANSTLTEQLSRRLTAD